jgi:putative ABC transport system permease protein
MVQVFVKKQEQEADCISSTSPHSLSFSIVQPINSKPKIRQYDTQERNTFSVRAHRVRRRIHVLEPTRSVFGIRPLTDHLSDSFAEDCLRTILLSFFGMTAISLACLGLYGTLSYFVTIPRCEIGVRPALGALRQQIASRFLLEGLCIAVGCASGLLIAAAASRLFSGMLYGVSSMDAVTVSGVAAILLVVAALSTLIPAAQAARTDPMQVLREE